MSDSEELKKVWIVVFDMGYDGSFDEGVFSSKEKAIEYINNATAKKPQKYSLVKIRGFS